MTNDAAVTSEPELDRPGVLEQPRRRRRAPRATGSARGRTPRSGARAMPGAAARSCTDGVSLAARTISDQPAVRRTVRAGSGRRQAAALPARARGRTSRRGGRRTRRSRPSPSAMRARRAEPSGSPIRFSYQNAPIAVAGGFAAQSGERRSRGRTVRGRSMPARARSSSTQPIPAAPLSRPTWTGTVGSPGSSAQADPAIAADRSQTPARRGDFAVAAIAGRARRPQVDPRDAGRAELESGRHRRAAAADRPAQPARAVRDRLVVHPAQQPACGREVGGIAVALVALEEHVGRSGRAREESGLARRVRGAARQRARAVCGQLAAAARRRRVRTRGTSGRRCGRRTRRARGRCRPGPCRRRGRRRARTGRRSTPTSTSSPGRTAFGLRDHPAHARERRVPGSAARA